MPTQEFVALLATFLAVFVGTLFRMSHVTHRITAATENVGKLDERVQTLEAANLDLHIENAALRGRLDEQRENYSVQIARLQNKVDELTLALAAGKVRETELGAQLDTATEHLTQARAEVVQLTAKVAALETKSTYLAEELVRLRAA
ncbi:MAG: hypothetical protein ABI947_01085 [Chloroflexota bacterium]